LTKKIAICIKSPPQGEGLELVSINQEDGNMHKITTSGRRIGISIDKEDGNIK
jgi:hypothetical protein